MLRGERREEGILLNLDQTIQSIRGRGEREVLQNFDQSLQSIPSTEDITNALGRL